MKNKTPDNKSRLDQLLVDRGQFDSRTRAQSAIRNGDIAVNGQIITKPAHIVEAEVEITEIGQTNPYVSRGGLKLAHALDHFGIVADGRVCLDLGASTGGFCDVLLRQGAALIYAVDVGTGQLHPTIRNNPKVVNFEQTHAKQLNRTMIPHAPSLLVCDVSFISLRKVLGYAIGVLDRPAQMICLIKPQFEMGPEKIGKGGLVSASPEEISRMLIDIEQWIIEQGFSSLGVIDSPISGGDGNHEFLIAAGR